MTRERNYFYHYDVDIRQTLVEFQIFIYSSQTYLIIQSLPFFFEGNQRM